jgi:hypothetical protein
MLVSPWRWQPRAAPQRLGAQLRDEDVALQSLVAGARRAMQGLGHRPLLLRLHVTYGKSEREHAEHFLMLAEDRHSDGAEIGRRLAALHRIARRADAREHPQCSRPLEARRHRCYQVPELVLRTPGVS